MGIGIETIFDLVLLTDEEYEKEFGHKKFEHPESKDSCLGCRCYEECRTQSEQTSVVVKQKTNMIVHFLKWLFE